MYVSDVIEYGLLAENCNRPLLVFVFVRYVSHHLLERVDSLELTACQERTIPSKSFLSSLPIKLISAKYSTHKE